MDTCRRSKTCGARVESRSDASTHGDADTAEVFQRKSVDRVFAGKDRLHHAAGHYDLAGLEAFAPRGKVRGKPGDRIERVAEDVAAVAFADRGGGFGRPTQHALEVRPVG